MLFDKVIAFDNLRQKIVLIGNVRADDVDSSYEKTCKDLEKIADIIINGNPAEEPGGRLLSEVKPLFDKERYCEMVEKAKYHIKEGDIFQIVLSNRLEADYEGSMLNVYRVLRTLNPSRVHHPRRSSSSRTESSTQSLSQAHAPEERLRKKTKRLKQIFSQTKKNSPSTIC